jgi:hypothetical protein
VKISLITSFKDTCFIEIVPKQHKSKRGRYNSFFILKSHLAIVCIMLAYISSTNFVQGYGEQCVWTCLLTWKYMEMSFGLCTHWSESVLCQFLYPTMTSCFLLVEIHLSFWAEVHYNSIYPLESKWWTLTCGLLCWLRCTCHWSNP